MTDRHTITEKTGAHMLQAVCSVLTPKSVRHGGMGRDLDFAGKGGEMGKEKEGERR